MLFDPVRPPNLAHATGQADEPGDLRYDLRDAAAKVLRANDHGAITIAAPQLYPHQWSWDAAFISIGLAHLSVPRACQELKSLLAAQWRTGMIPHIVFAEDEAPYFPGPDWWRAHELAAAAPEGARTSGICQPPAHAIGLARILEIARSRGGAEQQSAEEFLVEAWPALYAWHRWLVDSRRDPQSGLIAIVHSWESGLDNSPRWDEPYRAVRVGPLPPYRRQDIGVVEDESQRPGQREYDLYLWLVEELKHAQYDDAEIARSGSFRVGDVFMSAILATACDVLADLAADTSAVVAGAGVDGHRPPSPAQVADLRRWAAELRDAVAGSVAAPAGPPEASAGPPGAGLARDFDVRAGRWLSSDTIAGFAPLLCGGLSAGAERTMLDVFDGADWCAHPDLTVDAPPSTSLNSVSLDRRRYWRGPLWPVMLWLYEWALRRRGLTTYADRMQSAGVQLVADGRFAEYYEPVTGEALGSADQSWTAAVALDWLSRER